MFEVLKRLFNLNKITEDVLQNCVNAGMITQTQMVEITSKI